MKKHTEQRARTGAFDRGISAVRRSRWVNLVKRFVPTRLRAAISRLVQEHRRKSLIFPGSMDWKAGGHVQVEGEVGIHHDSVRGQGYLEGRSPGVNVICYAHGQFGLAEAARLYSAALRHEGYAIAVHDAGIEIPHEKETVVDNPHTTDPFPYAESLVFINPDHLADVLETLQLPMQKGRRNIGVWFWELERFPRAWLPALELVDEIIVATQFVEKALREVTSKPVTVIPQPLVDYPRSDLTRLDFGLDDAFTYLATFDFNSSMARKNPLGVVEAFIKAFPESGTNVRLLIKSSNGHRYPAELEVLLEAAARDSRITVRDQILARTDLTALFACVDAYISLHRAEGYGLGLAEAMWLGKPVVATAYSGNMDFMTHENSFLVDYERVPVRQGEYIHWEGQFWAEPDIEDAARQIRRLYGDPDQRRFISEAARISIRKSSSLQACGRSLLERLHGSVYPRMETELQVH